MPCAGKPLQFFPAREVTFAGRADRVGVVEVWFSCHGLRSLLERRLPGLLALLIVNREGREPFFLIGHDHEPCLSAPIVQGEPWLTLIHLESHFYPRRAGGIVQGNPWGAIVENMETHPVHAVAIM